MNRYIWIAGLWLLAAAAPGQAQFSDLLTEAQRLAFERDRPVTLSLADVTVKEALEKLTEATGVTLTCAPALAEKRVNVIARERSARQVGEGLARAVNGRWRREGDLWVLEPADALELLRPEELLSELRLVFVGLGGASQLSAGHAEQRVLELFAPPQIEAMWGEEGLPVALLAPQQQRQLQALLARRASESLHLAVYNYTMFSDLERGRVCLESGEGEQESTRYDENGTPTKTRRKVTTEQLVLRTSQGGTLWLEIWVR
ncbi:MAG: hypothetical protein GX774_20930 [Armatimonadetes bacterium]|nr:hypothetical protein [Armatimonadota bacterium]